MFISILKEFTSKQLSSLFMNLKKKLCLKFTFLKRFVFCKLKVDVEILLIIGIFYY